MTPAILGGWAAAAMTLGGVTALRRAWRSHRPVPATLIGWGLLALATVGWSAVAAWDKAVALALLAPSIAVAPLLVANAKFRRGRASRPPRAEVELEAAAGPSWRGWVRALYGGPVSGALALAFGTAIALHGLGGEADRLGIAMLVTPMVWAAGLIWSTTDPKLGRVASGLLAATLIGASAAVL